MDCPNCDGTGTLCDRCREPMVDCSQKCDRCGREFHAIARGVATVVDTGEKVDVGTKDCHAGHRCHPRRATTGSAV